MKYSIFLITIFSIFANALCYRNSTALISYDHDIKCFDTYKPVILKDCEFKNSSWFNKMHLVYYECSSGTMFCTDGNCIIL